MFWWGEYGFGIFELLLVVNGVLDGLENFIGELGFFCWYDFEICEGVLCVFLVVFGCFIDLFLEVDGCWIIFLGFCCLLFKLFIVLGYWFIKVLFGIDFVGEELFIILGLDVLLVGIVCIYGG